MKLVVALLLVFTVASASAPRIDVTGEYASNWDDVRLVQRGMDIHGTYVCCGGGTIEGRIYEGRVIRYQWKQPNGGEGEGVWEILPSGRLEGTWGSGGDDSHGGRWDLTPKSAIAN